MGKKRLEDAIKKIDHPVEVIYRSFELDPSMEKKVEFNIYEKLAHKYQMSIEQAKASCKNMEQMAETVGLKFNFETQVLTNTFDAHRLVMFAKKQGLMHVMTERLLQAYYTESMHIGDHQTLVELAVEVGLKRDDVAKVLASNEMSAEVRFDEQEANELGIRSIPFFLINKKYSITGAQSTETFVEALQQVFEEDQQIRVNNDEDVVCDENGCEIRKK